MELVDARKKARYSQEAVAGLLAAHVRKDGKQPR